MEDDNQQGLRETDRLAEFARTVGHDLRNPLNVAKGKLALAREECDSEHLPAIERALDRIETLSDDLLAVSPEREHEYATDPVVVANAVDECWQTVETPTATLSNDVDHIIQADRDRLKRLLENLIRNAVEHGGQNVVVMTGDLDTGFYIEDDGPGIPEPARDHVFRSGYSTAPNGTGLGLSVVEKIVDDHDWNVRVTEGSFGGTRFEITDVELSD
jgi:signal transduction histidine kinase